MRATDQQAATRVESWQAATNVDSEFVRVVDTSGELAYRLVSIVRCGGHCAQQHWQHCAVCCVQHECPILAVIRYLRRFSFPSRSARAMRSRRGGTFRAVGQARGSYSSQAQVVSTQHPNHAVSGLRPSASSIPFVDTQQALISSFQLTVYRHPYNITVAGARQLCGRQAVGRRRDRSEKRTKQKIM